MKKVLLLALGVLFGTLAAANAQTVTRQPFFAATNSWTDLGNGPLEVMPIEGSAIAYTSSSTSTATAGAAARANLTVALNLSPAPCVGCIVSGTGVTSGTTVVSYTPGTGVIVLSANLTATATGNVYSFGVACPTSGLPTAPSATGNSLSVPLNLRAGVEPFTAGIPLYSQARLCLYGGQQAGGTVVTFAIGAH